MILNLTKTFLRIFFRDRRAIMFSLFFPLVFMAIFSFTGSRDSITVSLGIADLANNGLSANFRQALAANGVFELTEGSEQQLRERVRQGDLQLALVIPPDFEDNGTATELPVVADAAQVRQLALIMPVLEQALVQAERTLRGNAPLFSLKVEDVQSRAQDYLSFLVPGLLAMSLMSISIAGSGFNIVEYRRKGILKRLFVTPIRPVHFISGLVISRTIICIIQLSVVLLIGVFVMGLHIAGSVLSLLLFILLGTAVFLSIGFSLGSIARTQETIQAVGNLVTLPQMLLSGIFYPIESLPALLRPFAELLPLSFVVSSFRDIIVNGASLIELLPQLAGLAIWGVITLVLAVRLFVWKEVAA